MDAALDRFRVFGFKQEAHFGLMGETFNFDVQFIFSILRRQSRGYRHRS